MKKAMVTVLLLAAALLAAAPVQAAIADTLAPAGIALSVLLSGAALAACIYCVVRVRQLVSEHHAFMQSVDKALREYSAQADTSAATINDLASGARAAVNQLSNRLVEQLDKLPVAHDGASAPATNVISIAPDNPKREELRGKFLDEHFHKEDEVRFFVAGSGLATWASFILMAMSN